ncbi:DUF899 family protein [Microbaculum marinum]|uniref:DUF899 family protein n=1 Tax=Microbaculum marinum TaxID=1764581 RepID=A0AAW9S3Y7_9HYPH
MDYADASGKLADYRRRIAALRAEMRDLQDRAEPQPVEDYVLQSTTGEVRLSEAFGGKDDLIVIHNMGRSCPYCTLWADGYNGVYEHLADRAAFVVTSPDSPAEQAAFAQSRGWRFPMLSHRGSSFADDMGYRGDNGWLPGTSVFRRDTGGIVRVSDAGFSPGDDFCSLWHFLDLLDGGRRGWRPKYRYG